MMSSSDFLAREPARADVDCLNSSLRGTWLSLIWVTVSELRAGGYGVAAKDVSVKAVSVFGKGVVNGDWVIGRY